MSAEGSAFDRAYMDLCGGRPPFPPSWVMALEILENWSWEKISERNALFVLSYIILFVEFPTSAVRTSVLLSVHDFLNELCPFATVRDARLINELLNQGKSVDEIRGLIARRNAW
jgi:hypothetical protein